MSPEESLQQHVQSQMMKETCPGPWLEDSLIYFTTKVWKDVLLLPGPHMMKKVSALYWSGVHVIAPKSTVPVTPLYAEQQWECSQVFDLVCTPVIILGDHTSAEDMDSSLGSRGCYPAAGNSQRKRFWGMLMQAYPPDVKEVLAGGLRELQILKNTQAAVTVLNAASGRILSQNCTSMAMLGIHGTLHCVSSVEMASVSSQDGMSSAVVPSKLIVHFRLNLAGRVQIIIAIEESRSKRMRGHDKGDHSYLQLLFNSSVEEFSNIFGTESRSGIFRTRLEISNPVLRFYMCLGEGVEAHHDVQVTRTQDPVTMDKIYIVSQLDVTEAVVAK
ncbi:hypothetical protein CEUSTIGMA_g5332.t1 [Chlamydomonas eustigma]|uniref:Uncharacterized protein n=1 Tax=Chlamydomonas eustigma TaxID=1157962 RepID=A0A250X554_9CHLO|nr:hypothetical protein CEUSTIGMA_g5332.t1 [Chlamydomonas eustigma]|eukprot:GAX77890.1 hypothetical protein CEUSTIGMA_g5332.t1 [Chlamydomonas eustigma]